MNSFTKLIKKNFYLLLVTLTSIFVLNLILFIYIIFSNNEKKLSPYTMAQDIAGKISENNYEFNGELEENLINENVWAIYVEGKNLKVKSKTPNTPSTIPQSYTLQEISDITLKYIDGYPTYIGKNEEGIVILGYPQNSYWKLVTPSWNYGFITNLPFYMLLCIFSNVLLISLLYFKHTKKLIRSIQPIVDGISDLSRNKSVRLPENSLLSDIEKQVNQTSRILESQKELIDKKDQTRNQWITGVSHDIRTPLSISIMKAEKLKNSSNITNVEREDSEEIIKQSNIIKNLVNDLNLATKLEYDYNTIEFEELNLNRLIREFTAEFMNNSIDRDLNIFLSDSVSENIINIQGNKRLLFRVLYNVVNNSIKHNSEKCNIYISLREDMESNSIIIEDDGKGITESELQEVMKAKHYLDENVNDNIGHGLGLKIVKQIMTLHKGKMIIGSSQDYNGFKTELVFNKVIDR